VVRVRDSGVGIPAEKLPFVFEMFVQLDGSRGRKDRGLGIGLALARRLVELHDGEISARSDGPGQGSEFSVRLPALSALAAEADATTPARQRLPRAALRVLVVDDLPDNSASLGVLLRRLGHEVEIANGGMEALLLAERFTPQVVLLDIGMPDLDGYEVCRRLRRRPWAAKATVVALTGWGQGQDREAAIEAGFDAHLVKPLDHHRLEELLAKVVPG
jgi:CheY-like chemotaxis protein